MGWLAIVVTAYGTLLTVPTVYSSYEQCVYHAHKIENLRNWTLDTPSITVDCVTSNKP